jgi:hypothetical protein
MLCGLIQKVLSGSFDTSTSVAKAALQHSDTGVSNTALRHRSIQFSRTVSVWRCESVTLSVNLLFLGDAQDNE